MKRSAALGVMIATAFVVADAGSQGTVFEVTGAADRYAGTTPLRVDFVAVTGGDHPPVRYRWCFDDGRQSRLREPVHMFRRAGYYSVVVHAKDADGHEARHLVSLGAWPAKQFADMQRQPYSQARRERAEREQRRRTRERRRELRGRGGLTRSRCTKRPL